MTQDRIARLLGIMAALRTPGTGCPWDLEQDFASIAPYTLEEAYEVVDAIERGDLAISRGLGDLLLQVVFHARLAEESGSFRLRRCGRSDLGQAHPPPSACVGDETAASAADVAVRWAAIKAQEKRLRAEQRGQGAQRWSEGKARRSMPIGAEAGAGCWAGFRPPCPL